VPNFPKLAAAAAMVFVTTVGSIQTARASDQKPTIVLVHGAFAEGASWNNVVADLTRDGYPVVAAANPLRSLAGDAAAIASIANSINGPVVLVGHSYGGSVITVAAADVKNVKALVYVAGFALAAGESSLDLTGKFPGSTLGATLSAPVTLSSGGKDLYVKQDRFPAQFAADLPSEQARLMAATQRPVTEAAISDKATSSAWEKIPSWSIYGTRDLNIPPASFVFMAERAKSVKTIAVEGASHVVMMSHPHEVAALIEDAATAK
jgi:pimeloyl-ACP methyl ester carboxylesterase